MIRLMITLLSLGIASGQLSDFKINTLPVGQGEALVLECPSNDIAIVDLGTSESVKNGFWNTKEVNEFFSSNNRFNRTKNIVISHDDSDHYNLLLKVFTSTSKLPALENIYITRTERELPLDLKVWIRMMKKNDNVKLQLINRGRQFCSLPQDPVIDLKLCPRDRSITSKVLFANLGNPKNLNTHSIVFRINYNQFSVLLNSDFDDIPDKACGQTFNNAQKRVQYGKMKSIVYKLAHHGGTDGNANNDEMLDVIKPKAVFVSANPWYRNKQYGHPRCHVIDYLTSTIKALCFPTSNCGTYFPAQSPISCCVKQGSCNTFWNRYGVYTTTPSEKQMSLITLSTGGQSWKFSYKNYVIG